jgi:NAD(P)-dependent dehydrogenase (short-subunit alcohol dehydrogenase family)
MNAQRNIVITGAGRGLGRALVAGFVAQGHVVRGCSQSPATVAALGKDFPAQAFDVVDVRDDESVAAWAKKLLAAGFVPDLLINNAAVMNATRPLWEIEPDDFHRVTDVNINGVYHCVRHFVPAMIERGSGVILNLSSGWGRSVSPEVAPYCASKFAVEGMTRALATELPAELAAIPLNPGVINTDMLQSCWGEDAASYPTPEQWAESAVPFLLQLGRKNNGQSLTVPGVPE